MFKDVRNIIAVAGGYTAAVIGAGFASGQEILSFFVLHGKFGFIGIVIASALFAAFAYTVMSACIKTGNYGYSAFLSDTFKSRAMKITSRAAVFVTSGVSLCVMIACMGELLYLNLGLNSVIGSALFSLLLLIILLLNARKIMSINAVLGIVITTGIIFACCYILRFREHQTFSSLASAGVSGISYAGYNLIGTGALLAYMSRFLKSRYDAALASLASAIAIFAMITLLWAVLGIYYGKINLGEIPMLTMALRQSRVFALFYTAMLAAAILTTAVSNGFALFDMTGLTQKRAYIIIVAAAFCISNIGFSQLVNNVYRICGYGGAVISFLIIINNLKKSKKERKMKNLKENSIKY